jgi:hypothetical protein
VKPSELALALHCVYNGDRSLDEANKEAEMIARASSGVPFGIPAALISSMMELQEAQGAACVETTAITTRYAGKTLTLVMWRKRISVIDILAELDAQRAQWHVICAIEEVHAHNPTATAYWLRAGALDWPLHRDLIEEVMKCSTKYT